MKLIRQGDVILIPVAVIPEGLVEVPRDKGFATLAYGEVTGHSHAILDTPNSPAVALLEEPTSGTRYLRVNRDTQLGHGVFSLGNFADAGEHGTLAVPAPSIGFGGYKVEIQKQYSPDSAQRVLD
jgi:hypothetical protein